MRLAFRQGLGNNDPANQSSNSRLSAWESCPGPFWLLFLLSHICYLIYMHQINTNCHIWARKGRCLPVAGAEGTFQGTKLPVKFQVSVFLENTHIYSLLQRHSTHTFNARIVYQLRMPWTYFRRQDLVSTAYLHLKSNKQCYFGYIIFWAVLRCRNVKENKNASS